jgi:hypothetical protein
MANSSNNLASLDSATFLEASVNATAQLIDANAVMRAALPRPARALQTRMALAEARSHVRAQPGVNLSNLHFRRQTHRPAAANRRRASSLRPLAQAWRGGRQPDACHPGPDVPAMSCRAFADCSCGANSSTDD